MKNLLLHVIKLLGGFWLSRLVVRRKTLILTYHNFEIIEETNFKPKLFIKKVTFEKRLAYLKKHNNIIGLNDLLKRDKPNNTVVITIDDGWAPTLTVAAPLLNHYKFPYVIYLATESVLAKQPIFHILLDYMLRSSLGKTLYLDDAKYKSTQTVITLQALPALIKKIKLLKSTKYDTDLLREISLRLGFSIDKLINDKIFTLLSVDEIKELTQLGADIQLHTHSHHDYIDDEATFNIEIKTNQLHIETITGIKPIHHCYPSGSFSRPCFNYLQSLGIETATTCIPGFCDEKSNKFALPRFLDGENIPQIVFEAEVSGVLEVLRKCRSELKSLIQFNYSWKTTNNK